MFMMPEMKVYLASSATDMRKSYDGLARLIKDEIGKDVFKGELFVFMSKRKDRVKMLYWDRNGSKGLRKGFLGSRCFKARWLFYRCKSFIFY